MECQLAFKQPFSGVTDSYAVYPIITMHIVAWVEPFSRHMHPCIAVNVKRHFVTFTKLPFRRRYLALQFWMGGRKFVRNLPENFWGKTVASIPRLFIFCFIHSYLHEHFVRNSHLRFGH